MTHFDGEPANLGKSRNNRAVRTALKNGEIIYLEGRKLNAIEGSGGQPQVRIIDPIRD